MPRYHYTFISHAHTDNALCDPYAAALTRLGAPHYYDRELPQHGALLPYLLQDEIRKAKVLVVMVTPTSQISQWVRLEVAMFHHLMNSEPDRKLVWIRLVRCDVEPLLAAHLGIDAVGRPFEAVLADLTRALEDRAAPTSARQRVELSDGSGGYSHVVDWRPGMGDHTTLTAAVAAARSGQRILVRKGLYVGSLIIDKPLEIVGTGQPGDVEVHASGADTILFTATQGRITSLTIRQIGGGNWFGVNIAAGQLEMEDCDIASQSLACVAIHGAANPSIRRCRMHSGQSVGIHISRQGQGLIEDCAIVANALTGVVVSDFGSPTMRGCRINKNGGTAIRVMDSSGGIYEQNDLRENTQGAWSIETDSIGTLIRRDNIE